MRLRALGTAALVMGLGFGVALALAPMEVAHVDEKHVLWQATSYGWLEIARNLMRDSHPPLYYWLIRLWWRIGGFDRPWAYRVFSMLLGLPALPLSFQLGRKIGGRRLGWMVMVFLAMNPFYLFQLQLIRMYGLVITLGALLTWLWLRWLDRPHRQIRWMWVLVSGAMLFTHYYGALLIGAQILVLLVRRPSGWRGALLGFLPILGLFGGWLLQAYPGSVGTTVRNLSAIPVRPMPWEVVEHLWANMLVGPLADGRFARGCGLATATLMMVSAIRGRLGFSEAWKTLGIAVGLPIVAGALLALRWPFFGARYFAMLLVPSLVWMLAPLVPRRWIMPVLCLPGLVGLTGFPLLIGRPDAGDVREISILSLVNSSDPILTQAWWHALWPEYPLFRAYDWSDLEQRERIVRRSPAFWFIGVTLYRGVWEGWLRQLRETHVVDYHTEMDHGVPERRASIFHLTRRQPPSTWEDVEVRWESGLRLRRIGWVQKTLQQGQPLQVALRWVAERPPDRRWTLFLHLVDMEGRLWANWDAEPDLPTDRWEVGREVEVDRSLLIPLNVPPGRYRVNIGWYETGTAGFPRVPLLGQPDGVWTLGEVEIRPRPEPSRLGAISASPVRLDPPVVRLVESPQGWHVEARLRWQADEGPASTTGWEVRVRTAWGSSVPLARAVSIPPAQVRDPGALTEVWISPPVSGGRPAIGWLEVRYEGRTLVRRPVWLFPAEVGWIYGWLFLNRFER